MGYNILLSFWQTAAYQISLLSCYADSLMKTSKNGWDSVDKKPLYSQGMWKTGALENLA
jgi:hypothetical protein